MDLLVFLAERQGEVVSRQQILDSVWTEVVVGDEVVSRAISLLRTELGDDQKNPRYVKTISKRGYCLIADVILVPSNEPQHVEAISDASASAAADNPTESTTRRSRRKLDRIILLVLAVAMAIGGLLNARKVADTMSKKISKLNHGQGFTANLITSLLVISASKFGLPVSTTHVSVGSIYGIGLVNGTANSREIAKIGLSWLLTLPVAALLSAGFYYAFHTLAR